VGDTLLTLGEGFRLDAISISSGLRQHAEHCVTFTGSQNGEERGALPKALGARGVRRCQVGDPVLRVALKYGA